MYCGSCLHDNTLAAALMRLGEDVLLVPTYTPIRTDEKDVSQPRVMFGGISVYLQQKWALFRHTPWLLDKLWDRPRLIDWLARRSISTAAEQLGDLTVSMLRGEEGNQRKEVEKIVHWLAHDVRPDIVHLSNSMLVGMARRDSSQAERADRLHALGRGHLSREAIGSLVPTGSRCAARTGAGRHGIRGAQSILCRLHGRLCRHRSRADSRHTSRPEAGGASHAQSARRTVQISRSVTSPAFAKTRDCTT